VDSQGVNNEDEAERLRKDARADQASAYMADIFAPQWWRLYKNLQDQGFKKKEAMKILQTYITSTVMSLYMKKE
jgi:hypothetical protein